MRNAIWLCLVVLGCGGGTFASWDPPLTVPVRLSGLSREQAIDHALSRLTYGARPGDAQRVASIGLERWIAQQLAPNRIADPRGDSITAAFPSIGKPTSEITELFRRVQADRRARQADTMSARRGPTEAQRRLQATLVDVSSARLARAVLSERQLYEQMVDFWENHFSVYSGKGQVRLFIPSYDRDVIRPRALGSFRDLLGAVAKSPAMLVYLDNAQSIADSSHRRMGGNRLPARVRGRGLNENYARELLELHTLGVDGGYTQQDVVEVARALTGWGVDQREGTFAFRAAVHDADEKVVLGQRLKSGRGIEDGEEVLDIVARHPATARHIARKLAIRFVSDSVPPQLVDRCAAIFTAKNGDIRETLQCIVTSPEFFSKEAYRAKVKTPFELVASAFRATGAVPDGSPRATQQVTRLGQPSFGRQTPDGWPDNGDEWMNAGAMVNRVNFGLAMASGRVPGARVPRPEPGVARMLTSPEFQRR